MRARARRSGALLALLLAGLPLAAPASARLPAASGRLRYAQVRHACQAPVPGQASCFALLRAPAPATAPGARPYLANDGAAGSGPAGGLTPEQLAHAYGYDAAGGSGQTIAIVDAFDDPNIEGDLGVFDSSFGFASCTSANGCFEKVGQTGSAASLPAPDTTGWSVEVALDVETARAVCGGCRILLVEANSPRFRDLATAVDEAVSLGASEVTNSYGGTEQELGGEERAALGSEERAAYEHPGVVITASTGDLGWDGWDELNKGHASPERPNVPASLPSVVAVGGTTLQLSETGARASERVWNGNGPGNESEYVEGVTGGGCSHIFTAPLWQQHAPGFAQAGCATRRLDADVSAVGDPLTGFSVYDSDECGAYCQTYGLGLGWATLGGTSLSAPLIASLYALAGGSQGVSYPALTLYAHLGDSASIYDVTEGANGFCGGETLAACGDPNSIFGFAVDCEGTSACNAAPGFDGPSGVGTPNGLGAFHPLLPSAVISAPASPSAGAAAPFSAALSSDPYPGGSLVGFSWEWGDGSGASGAEPSHVYAAPGNYRVSLRVTDAYGLTSAVGETLVSVGGVVSTSSASDGAPSGTTPLPGGGPPSSATQGTASFQAQLSPAIVDARLASATLEVAPSGEVGVRISCPPEESSCAGTVTLRTLGPVGASRAATPVRKPVLTLASGLFSVSAGKLETVTLHLSVKARRLLAHVHTLRARATVSAHDSAGQAHTGQQLVVLHLRRSRR